MGKHGSAGMDLDTFLDHSTGGGGGRGAFLGNWKKNDPPKIVIWLHTAAGFVARWVHGFQRIVVREDRETGDKRTEVWGASFVCHERELILKKQRFRDDEDAREYPPEVCPMCKAIEHVRKLVREHEIAWTDPIFRFEGDDPERNVVITAGGFYNAFARKDLTPKEIAELRRANIRRDEAWKKNGIARCQYVFSVVNDAEPEAGVQIATEAEALGNAMKARIRDKIEEAGREEGNPLRNPYAFLWEYREAEQIDKKYRVVPMTKQPLTDEIRRLIVEEPPPDLSDYTAPGNIATLRADMERFALITFPWDEIFGEAEKRAEAGATDFDPEEIEREEAEEKAAKSKAAATKAAKPAPAKAAPPPAKAAPAPPKATPPKAAKPAPKPEPEELFACDHCGFEGLKATDVECSTCGALFDEDGRMTHRPCVKDGCATLVEVGSEERTICEKCGTIHEVATWTAVTRTAAPAKAAPRTRSAAGKPSGSGKGGDDLPWGK